MSRASSTWDCRCCSDCSYGQVGMVQNEHDPSVPDRWRSLAPTGHKNWDVSMSSSVGGKRALTLLTLQYSHNPGLTTRLASQHCQLELGLAVNICKENKCKFNLRRGAKTRRKTKMRHTEGICSRLVWPPDLGHRPTFRHRPMLYAMGSLEGLE